MSEAAIHNASNDLKRLANFARGIIALDEHVTKYGQLESAINETKARLEKIRGEEAALIARHEEMATTAKASAEAMEKNATDVLNTAAATANEKLSNAEARAGAIVKQAQADATALVEKAKDEANKVIAATATLHSKHSALQAEYDSLVSLNAEFQSSIETKRADLDRLEGHIAGAFARFNAGKPADPVA